VLLQKATPQHMEHFVEWQKWKPQLQQQNSSRMIGHFPQYQFVASAQLEVVVMEWRRHQYYAYYLWMQLWELQI
jgi:hypothetical protein